MEHWRTSLAQNFQSVLERAEFDSQLALSITCVCISYLHCLLYL